MSFNPVDQLFEEFPRFETARLYLRPLDADDADALYAIFADEEVTRHYDLETFVEVSEATDLIDFIHESYETERQVRWGIVRTADDQLLGTCGFVWLRQSSAEIGYDLIRSAWGNGYMHEALMALLDFAFEELALNRIEALVMPGNVRSQRLLARLGFVHEGTLRQYDYFKGAFHDMQIHALLRGDRTWS